MLFSKNLIGLFNSDPEVINIGCKYLLTIGAFLIFICISCILTNSIKGAGEALFPLISSIISLWVIIIPTAYFFSNLLGINSVWFGISMGWSFGFI